MQKQFSIAEAKNRLPTIIHYVEKGPYVKLTRRGKPVAVLLSIQEDERLSRKYTGFWSAVSEFRRKIDDEGSVMKILERHQHEIVTAAAAGLA